LGACRETAQAQTENQSKGKMFEHSH